MPSLDEFTSNLARSGLLTAPEIDHAVEALPPAGGGEPAARLAQALIASGALTAYQARKVLGGITRGFFLGGCRVLKPLGEGGAGRVFLAHSPDGRQVAIKVLPPGRAAQEAHALERFQREMELSRRIRHPNVARTLAVGTEDDVNYMVMEFVPGHSLYDLIKTRGTLAVADAARFFLTVLDGLDAAHAAGLIHRDLKPTNLMLTPDGEAKILDLGLAHAMGEQSIYRPEGTVVGTLDYISPEQIDAPSEADQRSDLYSLGCALYFALAGRPPFEGGDLVNKIYKHRFETAEPLDHANPGVPPALSALVRRWMSKDRADRPPSARAARQELTRWANPEAIPSAPPAPTPPDNPFSALDDGDDEPEPAEPSPVPLGPRKPRRGGRGRNSFTTPWALLLGLLICLILLLLSLRL